MEFAFCTISEVLTYIGFAPFQFIPVSILTHIVSHKRDSVLLAIRTVLLWGVLFVFLFRKITIVSAATAAAIITA